jgi:hypothetical protein
MLNYLYFKESVVNYFINTEVSTPMNILDVRIHFKMKCTGSQQHVI